MIGFLPVLDRLGIISFLLPNLQGELLILILEVLDFLVLALDVLPNLLKLFAGLSFLVFIAFRVSF